VPQNKPLIIKRLLVVAPLLLTLLVGCTLLTSKPSDKQIESDLYFNKDNYELVSLKILGINVYGDLARAYVTYKLKRLNDEKRERVKTKSTGNMWDDLYIDSNTPPEKKGQIIDGSETLYYLKTDRGWLEIDEAEYKRTLYLRGKAIINNQ
jgi:hypothetical protein